MSDTKARADGRSPLATVAGLLRQARYSRWFRWHLVAALAVFFARAFLFSDPVASLANFGSFGLGMATPLLAFAVVSEPWRDRVLGFLTGHRRAVDAVTGLVLLGVSLYYLFAVFAVHEAIL
jgi:thiol:disulfide interchange protein